MASLKWVLLLKVKTPLNRRLINDIVQRMLGNGSLMTRFQCILRTMTLEENDIIMSRFTISVQLFQKKMVFTGSSDLYFLLHLLHYSIYDRRRRRRRRRRIYCNKRLLFTFCLLFSEQARVVCEYFNIQFKMFMFEKSI